MTPTSKTIDLDGEFVPYVIARSRARRKTIAIRLEADGSVLVRAPLRTPALIVQGTRDPFGPPQDVAGYTLSSSIFVDWIEGAGHDLVPSNTRTAPLGQSLERPIANALAFLQELVRT